MERQGARDSRDASKSDGFELTFTHEVDAKTAGDLSSYGMSAYTYIYQSKYGSPVVDKLTPKVIGAEVTGQESVRVTVDKLTKVTSTNCRPRASVR